MTDPTPDRPLVTFALFAYNQENYIREAIEGAFSQTYEPLEIILSDDCSSDRTFEIMQEMAEEYDGPHEVKVRRGENNQGTLAHVLSVAQLAKGKFLVVAAGDDISFPERTEVMSSAMLSAPRNVVVCSADDILFDDQGNTFDPEHDIVRRREFYSTSRCWFHGATACFRTDELSRLPMPPSKVLIEDMALMAVFKHLDKTSQRIERPLIRRRVHENNVGPIRLLQQQDQWARETRALQITARTAEAYKYAADAISFLGCDSDKLRKRSIFMQKYARWPEMSFLARGFLFPSAVSHGYAKSVLIRLPGRRVFLHIKRLISAVKA
ncbi:glycosyltransferase [Aquicoccus sp. SU-CL01552]|uniref:glycosyltransferase n=1 Tax=Aquicoccus sp. SU-CL01552 TaxID=3127656 RepID=UPI00310B9D37